MPRLLPALAVLALLALLAAALLRPRADAAQTGGTPLAGKPAPDFELATLDGGSLRLSSLRGRPVLVNFWASWCLPCRDEAPMLNQAARDGDGLVVLGVVYRDTPDKARAFRDEFRLGFPVLLDGDRTAVLYGLTGVPETFFISPDGRIVSRHAGPLTASALEAGLKGLKP